MLGPKPQGSVAMHGLESTFWRKERKFGNTENSANICADCVITLDWTLDITITGLSYRKSTAGFGKLCTSVPFSKHFSKLSKPSKSMKIFFAD